MLRTSTVDPRLCVDNDLKDATIVGHSLGGGIALVTSLYLQQSDHSRQRGLVLIDGIAYPQQMPMFIRLLATPVLGPLAVRVVPPEIQVREVMKLVYAKNSAVPEDAVKVYTQALKTFEGRHAAVTSARQIQHPQTWKTFLYSIQASRCRLSSFGVGRTGLSRSASRSDSTRRSPAHSCL